MTTHGSLEAHTENFEESIDNFFQKIERDISEISKCLEECSSMFKINPDENDFNVKLKDELNFEKIKKLLKNVSANLDIKNKYNQNIVNLIQDPDSLLKNFKEIYDNFLKLEELKFPNKQSALIKINNLIEKFESFDKRFWDAKNQVNSNLYRFVPQYQKNYEKMKTDKGFPVERIIWIDKNHDNAQNSNNFGKLKDKLKDKSLQIIKILDLEEFQLPILSRTDANRTILITSGSASKTVIDKCYDILNICKIIVFCHNVEQYKDYLKQSEKISVVNKFPEVLKLIHETISGKIKSDYLLPIDFNKIPENINRYLSMDKYGFKSFDEVPRNETAYSTLQEIVKLKGWKWDDVNEETINDDIKRFISIFKKYKDDQEISIEIIALYTDESPFYKIINRCLGSVDETCISSCEVWIKALKLALETYDYKQPQTFFRGISWNLNDDVYEKYKIGSFIVFPAFTSTSTDELTAFRFGFGLGHNDKKKGCIIFKILYEFKDCWKFFFI
jgi:hypothetical protein